MDEEEEEMGSDLEGMAPTPKRRRLANASALMASLQSGLYPEFLGVHGPSQDLNPNDSHYCQIIKKKPQHYINLIRMYCVSCTIVQDTLLCRISSSLTFYY